MSDMSKELKLKERKDKLETESLKLRQEEKRLNEKRILEFGSIVDKANLGLDSESLYGAMNYIKEVIENDSSIKDKWKQYWVEQNVVKKSKTAVMLKTEEVKKEMVNEVFSRIRKHNLRLNSFRREWYGYVVDAEGLREYLDDLEIRYEMDEV